MNSSFANWTRPANAGLSFLLVLLLAFTAWQVVRKPIKGAFAAEPSRQLPDLLVLGESFRLEGADWKQSERHLVLATQASCPFSTASAGFYKDVSSTAHRLGIPLIVVSPDPKEVISGWLTAHGISHDRLYPALDLWQAGFAVTPTLVSVDNAGLVIGITEGRLTVEQEADVLAHLAAPTGAALDNARSPALVTNSEFVARSSALPVQVVDIRSREEFQSRHRSGAVNIPHDEFRLRAEAELDLSMPVAIDCLGSNLSRCVKAGRTLKGLGLSPLVVVPDDQISK